MQAPMTNPAMVLRDADGSRLRTSGRRRWPGKPWRTGSCGVSCRHRWCAAFAGNRLITAYVVGRTSGRHYTIPVAYTRHDGSLLIGTQFASGDATCAPASRWISGSRASGDRPRFKSAPTRPALSSCTPSWRATTTALLNSTRSASIRRAPRTPPTCAWPGPQAPEPSA